MENDCPECFGKKEQFGKTPNCNSCEYKESCEYCCADDGKECERNSGHVSYERYAYSEEVAAPATVPDDEIHVNDDINDVRQVMEFLLDIDNYTAELLSAVLHDPQCTSASALAIQFGIARQIMHRKLIDCCHRHPHLRKLFITRLTGCRRILKNSSRIEKQELLIKSKNTNQMELF